MENKYFIVVTSRYCKFQVRINDCLCYVNHKGLQSGGEALVNEMLLSGINALTISLEPNQVEYSGFDIVLMVNVKVERRDETGTTEICNAGGEFPIDASPRNLADTFVVTEETQEQLHANCPIISIKPENINALVTFYQSIIEALRNKQVKRFVELVAMRERFYAQAFGLDYDARLKYIDYSISTLLNEDGAELLNLDMNYLEVGIYGGGKLVTLQEKATMESAIGVYVPAHDTITFLPVYLGMIDDEYQILK